MNGFTANIVLRSIARDRLMLALAQECTRTCSGCSQHRNMIPQPKFDTENHACMVLGREGAAAARRAPSAAVGTPAQAGKGY